MDENMDWSAARREVADIEKLGDQDLDKLFDDIVSFRALIEVHELTARSKSERSESVPSRDSTLRRSSNRGSCRPRRRKSRSKIPGSLLRVRR
jgi:hypothetical protein